MTIATIYNYLCGYNLLVSKLLYMNYMLIATKDYYYFSYDLCIKPIMHIEKCVNY